MLDGASMKFAAGSTPAARTAMNGKRFGKTVEILIDCLVVEPTGGELSFVAPRWVWRGQHTYHFHLLSVKEPRNVEIGKYA